ncbi:hypothetical protein H6G64_03950 [Calothrix sp. FACHB-156]|nr:hypothetical protein [Calothrix sp. FACHB-156]
MKSDEFEYREHRLVVSNFGTSNGKKVYSYSIENKCFAEKHYPSAYKRDFYSPSEAAKAGKDAIDSAFSSVERLAKFQRQLTKNDYNGFVALLTDSNIPNEQIPILAIEMMKAHYQRVNATKV